MGSAATLSTQGSTVAALRSEPGSLKPQGISPLGRTQKCTEHITLVQTVTLTLTFTITNAHTNPILVLTLTPALTLLLTRILAQIKY